MSRKKIQTFTCDNCGRDITGTTTSFTGIALMQTPPGPWGFQVRFHGVDFEVDAADIHWCSSTCLQKWMRSKIEATRPFISNNDPGEDH